MILNQIKSMDTIGNFYIIKGLHFGTDQILVQHRIYFPILFKHLHNPKTSGGSSIGTVK